MANDYEKRLLRVLDYVYDNLDGDLSLDALADVAALSRFHFHRVFSAVTGETLAHFIRRLRLHRAGIELIHTDAPIAEIAAALGYDNLRSFSRSFRDAFGQTPHAFRTANKPVPPLRLGEQGDMTLYDVKIENQPGRRLALVDHIGPYIEISQAFDTAETSVMARGLGDHLRGMIGLYYDDPDNVPADKLRSAAGFIVTEDMPIEAPLQEVQLQGGKHAILTYTGPYSGLARAYQFLFGQWLGEAGVMPREEPPFEMYLNSPMDTAPEDLVTVIGVPLL